MIRTHIFPCALPPPVADALNRASGAIYTSVLVSHWRVVRHQDHWLSEKTGTRWSDLRLPVKPLHAHSIDAAQQGFYNACRTTHGSRRQRRLRRARSRMQAKHARVLRDMEHKVSRHIVDVTVERQAGTIVLGDVRAVADGVDLSKATNQKISGWSHGKIRAYVAYKAQAEGIQLVLQDEHYTSQTCPHCGHRHKPRGRVYTCGQCGFSGHRDVVGQINILSAYTCGTPGKLPMPHTIKQRRPALGNEKRSMRRCRDTGQTTTVCSLEHSHV